MHKLAESLHSFIMRMMQSDWNHLNIIFSDSNVPGEGEHKILDFIRAQRSMPAYNPNTKHVIHGADADLIMLSLITHEAHFYIAREQILDSRNASCRTCGQQGHFETDCQAVSERLSNNQLKLCFVKIPVVRQYLDYEFGELKRYSQYDLERIIDDFVFLCFFVGNDFLPHLPSLNIRDGAIDGLIFLYVRIFSKLQGYLTEEGKVRL